MAVIPAEVQEMFKSVEFVTLCTANAEGMPNGNIVAMKALINDECIYLSDQFFKKTLANIQANPQVAVSFCADHKAYEICGNARYVNEGPEFEEQAAWVNAAFEQMGMPVKAKGGIFVDVTAVYNECSGPDAGAQMA